MINKSKYKNLREWRLAKPKDYQSAVSQGLTVLICKHYGWKYNKPSGYWTKELCIKEALKYNTTGDWKRGCGSSYQAASTNGWLVECSKHFNNINRPAGYWTKERCMEEAKKWNYKADWERGSSSSHSAARKNGWYDDCVAHMTDINKPSGYWNNKKNVLKEAQKWSKKSYWKRGSGSSFNSAIKNGWYDECTKHMK